MLMSPLSSSRKIDSTRLPAGIFLPVSLLSEELGGQCSWFALAPGYWTPIILAKSQRLAKPNSVVHTSTSVHCRSLDNFSKPSGLRGPSSSFADRGQPGCIGMPASGLSVRPRQRSPAMPWRVTENVPILAAGLFTCGTYLWPVQNIVNKSAQPLGSDVDVTLSLSYARCASWRAS